MTEDEDTGPRPIGDDILIEHLTNETFVMVCRCLLEHRSYRFALTAKEKARLLAQTMRQEVPLPRDGKGMGSVDQFAQVATEIGTIVNSLRK